LPSTLHHGVRWRWGDTINISWVVQLKFVRSFSWGDFVLLMLEITTRFSPMTDEALSFSRTHTHAHKLRLRLK
jgi:hypothetical protein